jgi:hypothetical protein
MLLGVSSLTRLELSAFDGIDAGVLAEKPLRQHLALPCLDTDPLELMSQLQNMQQLTYLDLSGSDLKWGSPPAAAYAALTASSRLQHLDISSCQVRVGFWQHMFPAGRQLPSLRSLDLASVEVKQFAAGAMGSRLVACCPSLRSINIHRLPGRAALRFALQGIEGVRVYPE